MTTFLTSRVIPAPIEDVFAAIADPERLNRWWGPEGFTNSYTVCDVRTGGVWSMVMHGPDGKHYANENRFAEVDAPSKVIVEHVGEPKYRLTITLSSAGEGTTVSWSQTFENPEVAAKIEHIVVPANDQNLAKLSAEVLTGN